MKIYSWFRERGTAVRIAVERQTGSAFYKLMASFLAMLLLPFAVLLFNYIYARQLLRQENLNYQNAVLIQAQKMIDEKLQALQLFALDVANDSEIQSFLLGDSLSGVELQLEIRNISERLSSYGVNYRDLCTCYVYSINYDYLISANGADSGVSDEIIRLPTDELNRRLQQKIMEPRQFCRYSVLRDGESRQLVMIHSVPMWSTGEPENGAVCLMVDDAQLLKHVSTMDELRSGLVCLMDADYQPIMYTGDETLTASLAQAAELGHGFMEVNGAQYTVSTVKSQIGGWQYISIQPQHLLLARLHLTRNLSFLVLLLVLVLGIVAAYLLSRTNYRPIQKLMGALRRQAGVLRRQADSENEFDLIERSVQDIASSMSALRTLVQDELPRVQESMLLQLLRNAVTDYTAFGNTLSDMGILLPYRRFAVAVIRQPEADSGTLEEQALVNVVLKEQLIKIMPCTIAYADVVMQSDMMALILNSDHPDFETQAATALRTLADGMREEFSRMVDVTLSRVFDGIERVPHAFYTASQYKSTMPGGVTLLSSQPAARVERAPDELITPLQNCIAAGNLDQALELLRRSYRHCIEGRALPLHTLRGYYVNVLSIIQAAQPQIVEEEQTDWLQMLFMQRSAEEMQQTVERRTKELCDHVRDTQKTHASQLTEQILDFLQREYANSELTLSYTADHFYITSSYLSSFFKENVGDTFLNYLTRLRIDHAKEMIRGTNLPMGEIATRVGYTSGNTFTRIFKKLEHVTPSQYRESAQK